MPRSVIVFAAIAFAAIAFVLSGYAPVRAELLVSVSKSQQRMSVMVDGAETYRWPVSTGTRGHETPSGSFKPHDIERHWYSRQYSRTPMPWAVFFHRGYAVHGTMEAYNLGRAASHGCVRLRPDNASILFALVRRHSMQNTKVVVMNGPLPPAPGALPMADAGTPPAELAADDSFAMVSGGDRVEYAAKSHPTAGTARNDEPDDMAKPAKTRLAGVEAYRVSVGSDEAQILRERQAWLRSIDRKYGFAR